MLGLCVFVCAGIELRETSVRYYESCMERKCKPAYVCLLGPQGIRPVYVCVFTSVSGSVFMFMFVCVFAEYITGHEYIMSINPFRQQSPSSLEDLTLTQFPVH